MNPILVVLCTCPDDSVAKKLAGGLVEQRLAACVNVLPGIRSIYRWQGRVQDDGEVLMVIKSSQETYAALERWLSEQHPYELPEIIALPVERGLPGYLEWVAEETTR
jgi:periplasmic divalent cation tolerance protein